MAKTFRMNKLAFLFLAIGLMAGMSITALAESNDTEDALQKKGGSSIMSDRADLLVLGNVITMDEHGIL